MKTTDDGFTFDEPTRGTLHCRFCGAYHEVDQHGAPEGVCYAEKEHKRIVREPLRYVLMDLPDRLWPEVRQLSPLMLESVALVVERAAEEWEHATDAEAWQSRWIPILRELEGANRLEQVENERDDIAAGFNTAFRAIGRLKQ